MGGFRRDTIREVKEDARYLYTPSDDKDRADKIRRRLRQKLNKKKQYKIKYDLYKNGMTTKILI
jgi:hypothetical protein